MTLAGLGWVLMWGLISFYLLRWMWRTRERPQGPAVPETVQPARPRLRASSTPRSSLPRGWTVEDYAADGIRQLQIMLIQQSRRNRPLDGSGQA